VGGRVAPAAFAVGTV